jgi:hypothetical protein
MALFKLGLGRPDQERGNVLVDIWSTVALVPSSKVTWPSLASGAGMARLRLAK